MLFLHFHIQLFEVRKCRRGYKHQQERNRRVCVDDGLRSRSQRGTQICSIFRHDLLLIKTRGEASEMRNADWLGFVCSAKMVSQASRTNFKMQQNVLSSNLKQILITYFAYTWRQPAVRCGTENQFLARAMSRKNFFMSQASYTKWSNYLMPWHRITHA